MVLLGTVLCSIRRSLRFLWRPRRSFFLSSSTVCQSNCVNRPRTFYPLLSCFLMLYHPDGLSHAPYSSTTGSSLLLVTQHHSFHYSTLLNPFHGLHRMYSPSFSWLIASRVIALVGSCFSRHSFLDRVFLTLFPESCFYASLGRPLVLLFFSGIYYLYVSLYRYRIFIQCQSKRVRQHTSCLELSQKRRIVV